MSESAERVLERVLGGEIDAYAELVRRHQDEVWRIAALALRDVAATEDLVQQVFVNAYLALPGFERGRDFGVWLRSIARNQVRKELRDSLRRERKLRRYHDWLLVDLERSEESERRMDTLREALARCREELAEPAGEALAMRYDRALSFEQIAAALGRTVAATRQLLTRVRLALRQCIERRMEHP